MPIVKKPPIMLSAAIAVCGTQFPKTTVAPTNGAVNSQILAQTTVENAQIFFFSLHTSSVLHVVSIAKVDDMATLDTIDIAIRTATRASPLAVKTDSFLSRKKNSKESGELTFRWNEPNCERHRCAHNIENSGPQPLFLCVQDEQQSDENSSDLAKGWKIF